MKKIMNFFVLSSIAFNSTQIVSSCSSSQDQISKIVNFSDPKTDERWTQLLSDYSQNVNDIWTTYEENWVDDINDAYSSWTLDHGDDETFNTVVDRINKEETLNFINSNELQLIMAYTISYDYCSLKKQDLVDSQSIINIKNEVKFMYEGYTSSDNVEVEYPAVFYQSITYPYKYDGVGNGTSIDINYNTEVTNSTIDKKIIKRLKKAYELLDGNEPGEINPDIPSDTTPIDLGNITIDVSDDNLTTDIIASNVLEKYNETMAGKNNKGYSVKEVKLTKDSTTATIVDKDDNEINVTFTINKEGKNDYFG